MQENMVYFHIWCTVTYGILSHVVCCHMWYIVTCGTVSQMVYCHMWYTFTCGILSHVVQCHKWCTVTCGILSHVVYFHMWYTITYGILSHMVYCHIWYTSKHVHTSKNRRNKWQYVDIVYNYLKSSSFQTFAVFWLLYSFFWVIPWRLNFILRHFGTLCLFHLYRRCN